MRLYYFTELPGLAVTTQQAMVDDWRSASSWTDSFKSFPEQRDRMLAALRHGSDEIWVASLAVLAANRLDLRHVLNRLADVGANIIEGATGWELRAPFGEGLAIANVQDYWANRRKLTDEPRSAGVAARKGAVKAKMPEADARVIWFDPTIPSNAAAIEQMNSDPRYRGLWTYSCAAHKFKASGRPAGTRKRRSLPTETDE